MINELELTAFLTKSKAKLRMVSVFGKTITILWPRQNNTLALNRLKNLHDLNPVLKRQGGTHLCLGGFFFFWVVLFSFPGKTVGNE